MAEPTLARLLAAAIGAGVSQGGLVLHLSAATPPEPAAQAAADTGAETGGGPERLKQAVRITLETNTPAAATATNRAALKERTFAWKFSWNGWHGLDVEITRKTLLGQWLPGLTNLEQNLAPQALLRENPATNAARLHLEEAKMSGTIGGRIDLDGAGYITGNQFQGFEDGVQVRRARLNLRGDCILVMPVSYEIQVGYVPHQVSLQDTFVAFPNLWVLGELKIGEYQPPMSLEAITSSRDITFMELAAPVQALAPGSDAGAQIGRPVLNERMTWKFGLFAQGLGEDVGDASQSFARAITRLTALPVYEADPDRPYATRLLHLGLSANILYSADSTVHYQSRPESYLAPYVVNTGSIPAEGALVIGGEAAWVNGPFSLQGEYLHSFVRETGGDILNFYGFYGFASWFLTGETRPYDRRKACFGRVIPKHDFSWGRGGWGAWEIAARYSFVNLNSGDINGGRLSMLMSGVNGYLHPHVTWRFEYGFGHVSESYAQGNLNIFQTRVEVDF